MENQNRQLQVMVGNPRQPALRVGSIIVIAWFPCNGVPSMSQPVTVKTALPVSAVRVIEDIYLGKYDLVKHAKALSCKHIFY
jgi:hypothetical protein